MSTRVPHPDIVTDQLLDRNGLDKTEVGGPADELGSHRLSFQQHAVWQMFNAGTGTSANVTLLCRLRRPANAAQMRVAFNCLLERHPSLRTVYSVTGTSVSQHPATECSCDFAAVPTGHWNAKAIDERIEQDSEQAFDLLRGPVFRARLYSGSTAGDLLLLCAHQLAADAHSLVLLLEEFDAIFTGLSRERTRRLPVLQQTYFDYARQQREAANNSGWHSSIEFWHNELSDSPPSLELPLDRRRRPGQASLPLGELRFSLPRQLTTSLDQLARQEAVPVSAVYLAAYAVQLSRYSNASDVLVGSTVTARTSDVTRLVGNFTNIVPIRTSCTPDTRFGMLLHKMFRTISAAEQHGHVPFQYLTESLGLTAPPGRAPLFDACFFCEAEDALKHTVPRSLEVLALKPTQPVYNRFDIALSIPYTAGAVHPSLFYRQDLFDRATLERMARHWERLLQSIVSNPEAPVNRLEMMPDEEHALVLGEYAGTPTPYPRACLHELFAEQVALRPDAEAVVFGAKRLTYKQLDERSNQVAHFLRSRGIAPEDRIGIFMDRSAGMIVAMLGVLKAGGAYAPIDPEYPTERLKFIAEDIAVRVVLTEQGITASLPTSAPLIYIDGPESPIADASSNPVDNQSTPESIAIVIYTSGSTGRPKAACLPHRAAVRTVRDTNHVQVTPQDRIAQVASPSFDAALSEIWLALANGAALVGMRRETLLDYVKSRELIQKEKISILILNTAYVHQLGREAPGAMQGVRKILFGGEAAEPGPIRRLLAYMGPGVLVNGYGPAEGCVTTTCYEINHVPEDATTIPIGRPVSNAQVYLLDNCRQPVPIGVPGEIYIGGEGLARGYWNRPELTAERFLPDTFSGKPGGLLYRTGDIARMRGNGEFEFIGRVDEQVKIRGHRIELAEVREAILSHADVNQVFLRVREDQPGDKRLVAYVTLRNNLASAPDLLRGHVKNKLPAHMVPASFIVVDSIPLTTNGKVDWRALPAPGARPDLRTSYTAAGDDLERTLVKIWQELLLVDNVGIHDNFFELGGHSLLAARLVAEIEKATVHNIPVAVLFEAPTIAQLVKKLRRGTYESAWSPLVQLVAPPSEAKTDPFFCVHSLGANLVSFHKIASLLRGDRGIYGLQPHGLDGKQKPLDTVEAIARAYLAEIRKKQPHGPYHIGGICLGGVIAYEMAQQLQAAEETVAPIICMDSFAPGELQYLHARSNLLEFVDRHLGQMLLLRGAARWLYPFRCLSNAATRLPQTIGFQQQDSLARATRRVTSAHMSALLSYQPKPYVGKVVQVMCSDSSQRCYEDRRLAWSTLASEGLDLHLVPGNHLTMVEEPHVRVLAEKLQWLLDQQS
jgi:amino acid adenylation domain-containing protein